MAIDKIAVLLAVIGALNWGGIGLFGFDAVARSEERRVGKECRL